MCKLCKLIFVLALTLMTVSSVSVEAAKKVVAVMPLENLSGYEEQKVAEIMTEQLSTTIHNSGNYTVVERTQLSTVLKEQGFQNIAANPQTAVETGKLTGAQYTILGKVTMADVTANELKVIANRFGIGKGKLANPYECKVALDFRFVDNQTGEVIFAKTVEGTKAGDSKEIVLYGACKEAAQNALLEIQNHNPFVARIVEIAGEDIYIDQGVESGLHKGETLVIAREGGPIVINGKIVGMKQTKVGLAQVVEVNAEYSICRITLDNGVKKNDIVKRES